MKTHQQLYGAVQQFAVTKPLRCQSACAYRVLTVRRKSRLRNSALLQQVLTTKGARRQVVLIFRGSTVLMRTRPERLIRLVSLFGEALVCGAARGVVFPRRRALTVPAKTWVLELIRVARDAPLLVVRRQVACGWLGWIVPMKTPQQLCGAAQHFAVTKSVRCQDACAYLVLIVRTKRWLRNSVPLEQVLATTSARRQVVCIFFWLQGLVDLQGPIVVARKVRGQRTRACRSMFGNGSHLLRWTRKSAVRVCGVAVAAGSALDCRWLGAVSVLCMPRALRTDLSLTRSPTTSCRNS